MKSKGKLIPVAPPESQYSLELKQDKNMSSSLVHFDSIEELIDGYNFLCAMNIYFNWIKVEGQPFYEECGHDDEYLDIQDIISDMRLSFNDEYYDYFFRLSETIVSSYANIAIDDNWHFSSETLLCDFNINETIVVYSHDGLREILKFEKYDKEFIRLMFDKFYELHKDAEFMKDKDYGAFIDKFNNNIF